MLPCRRSDLELAVSIILYNGFSISIQWAYIMGHIQSTLAFKLLNSSSPNTTLKHYHHFPNTGWNRPYVSPKGVNRYLANHCSLSRSAPFQVSNRLTNTSQRCLLHRWREGFIEKRSQTIKFPKKGKKPTRQPKRRLVLGTHTEIHSTHLFLVTVCE